MLLRTKLAVASVLLVFAFGSQISTSAQESAAKTLATGTFHGEPLYHASLAETEYRSLLDNNDFDVVSHVIEDPNCGHHTIWLAQLR